MGKQPNKTGGYPGRNGGRGGKDWIRGY